MVPEVNAKSLGNRPGRFLGSAGPVLRGLLTSIFRNPILRIVLRRLLLSVPLVIVVSALSFVLLSLTPGNAADAILGPSAAPSEYPKLTAALGLNQPIYTQYWHWLEHALQGNLGISILSDQSVTQIIDQRLPVTLSLIGGAVLVSVIFGVSLGIFSALRGGIVGRVTDGFALLGFALPGFWIAAELIVLFAVKLAWFPATGYVSLAQSPSQWLQSLVLPVTSLALGGAAAIAKQTREAMLDVLGSEHIRMAWANGLSPRSIVFRHALRNAAPPIITVLGLQVVSLLGGTILVETIFALPGLGSLVVNSALQHDLPVVTGVAVYFTVIVVIVNLLIDLAYTWLNPRVRTA
jgi:peptide/nickel transport system permease protein